MSRPRVTLYEFVPYGAPELLEMREIYLTRALATASTGLAVLFAIALFTSAWLARHAGENLIPRDVGFTLAPPPLLDPPTPPPPRPMAPTAPPPMAALPVLVPDQSAPPDQTIVSQDELRQSNPGDSPADGGGGVVLAPPADEPVPGMTNYVHYDEPPALVTQVKPIYPDLAREAGVDGTVQLRVLVGKDGLVKDVHVDRSIALLDEAAVAAARRWVFTPALSNGHPVMVWVAVPVRFTLH